MGLMNWLMDKQSVEDAASFLLPGNSKLREERQREIER